MSSPDHLPAIVPANHVPGPAQGQWTYEDYANLPDDGKRYEVVDGVLFMTPAPSIKHQQVIGGIFARLREVVTLQKRGQVFLSPCDVELLPRTIVQPDLFVILNEEADKITTKRIIGAPNLLIEITSPSSVGFDRREKQNAYARVGVSEYWIVDPIAQDIELFFLDAESYQSQGIFRGQAILPSRVIPDLKIATHLFFEP